MARCGFLLGLILLLAQPAHALFFCADTSGDPVVLHPEHVTRAACLGAGYRWLFEPDEDSNGYIDYVVGGLNNEPSANVKTVLEAADYAAIKTLLGYLDSADTSGWDQNASDDFDGAFSSLTGTPTTIAGYGITDAATSAQGALADTAVQPADLSGYDTDASDDITTGANEISALTEKITPVSADLVLIEDSAAAGVKKKVQVGNLPSGGSSDAVDINITDSGSYYTGTEVETALQETGAKLNDKTVTTANGGEANDILNMDFIFQGQEAFPKYSGGPIHVRSRMSGTDPVGTIHGISSHARIATSGNDLNEVTALFTDTNADATSRVWGTDQNVMGPYAEQADLILGISSYTGNYNASAVSDGAWGIVQTTKPGKGGGDQGTDRHARQSYPLDAGLAIVGWAGTNTSTPDGSGYDKGIQIGGGAGGWMETTESSWLETGIDITDTDTYGLYIHDVLSGDAINVASTGGAVDINSTLEIPSGTSLPGTCVADELFRLTTGGTGQQLYVCETTNTWGVVGTAASSDNLSFTDPFTGSNDDPPTTQYWADPVTDGDTGSGVTIQTNQLRLRCTSSIAATYQSAYVYTAAGKSFNIGPGAKLSFEWYSSAPTATSVLFRAEVSSIVAAGEYVYLQIAQNGANWNLKLFDNVTGQIAINASVAITSGDVLALVFEDASTVTVTKNGTPVTSLDSVTHGATLDYGARARVSNFNNTTTQEDFLIDNLTVVPSINVSITGNDNEILFNDAGSIGSVPWFEIDPAAAGISIESLTTSTARGIIVYQHFNGAAGANIAGYKSMSSDNTPGAGDAISGAGNLNTYLGYGWDGNSYELAGGLYLRSDGAFTDGVPVGAFQVFLDDGSTYNNVLAIDHNGVMTVPDLDCAGGQICATSGVLSCCP